MIVLLLVAPAAGGEIADLVGGGAALNETNSLNARNLVEDPSKPGVSETEAVSGGACDRNDGTSAIPGEGEKTPLPEGEEARSAPPKSGDGGEGDQVNTTVTPATAAGDLPLEETNGPDTHVPVENQSTPEAAGTGEPAFGGTSNQSDSTSAAPEEEETPPPDDGKSHSAPPEAGNATVTPAPITLEGPGTPAGEGNMTGSLQEDAPEKRIAIVTSDTQRRAAITNVTGNVPLNVSLFPEEEAISHDFSSDPLIFAASIGNETAERINSTVGENATIILYDPPPDTAFGTPADQNISRYWQYGGDGNVLNMLLYIDNIYFGNSTTVDPPQLPKEKAPRIVMIIGGESYVPMYIEAAEKSSANVTVYPAKNLPAELNLTGYDLIFLEMFGAGIDIIEPAVKDATALGIPVVVLHGGKYEYLGTVDMTAHPQIEIYWDNNCPENALRLIDYISARLCGTDVPVKEPIIIPGECIYHPDAEELFENLDDYLAWYYSAYDPSKPTIGIVFYGSHYRSGDLRGDDAIMRAFEARGANILPVFPDTKDPHVIDRFFVKNGTPVIDAIVNIRCFRFYGSDENPERGIAELKAYNIPIINALVDYSKTPEEWANSIDGITASKIGYSIAMPELDGQTEFIWTAGRGIDPDMEAIGFRPITPVDEQIDWLADRVLALVKLRHTPNPDKRVAVIYYNHGGGKNNLGASYLDIVPSLKNLLNAMKVEGYSVAGEVPDEDALLDLMLLQGRNVGTWAPKELERMVEDGDVVLLPAATYAEWFRGLPAERQQEVIEKWGEPPGEIMVYRNGGEQYLVIPTISFGNVLLAPQPTRGWLQDEEVLYHDKDLPPHHQYIAFYLWLQNEFGADAIVHFGRHGTHEWLPGKERGLSTTDWPPLLIGDCPNIYPYIMDGLGEGTQAKRRGNAVIVDHLTSPIVTAGLYGNFSVLHEKIHTYSTVNATLKDEYRKSITELYEGMNLHENLGRTVAEIEAMSETEFTGFINNDLHRYLHKLGDEFIPYGLHILGEPPEGDELVLLIRAMLGEEFEEHVGKVYSDPHDLSAAHGDCTVLEALLREVLINGATSGAAQQSILGSISADVTTDLDTAIRYRGDIAGCDVEIPAIINALNGGFIPPKTGGDPVRSPYSLPTGNNFHSFDSRIMPTEEAWRVGVQMADEMIKQYQDGHDGAYPEKVAFVLWACEAMRHEGVTESEALYLLGVKPVWSKGQVKSLELIPSSKLGRPRIDVLFLTSGLYRDTFADKIELLDEAVRLAAQAEGDGYPNYVKQHSDALYQHLIASGYNETAARSLSMARIFSSAPGAYGTGLSSAIDASGTWTDEAKLAELFISKMGYIYGSGTWGEPDTDLFRANLGGVEAAVHSRSSNLYGLVDNDDYFQYVGALSLAVRYLTGTAPETFITDLRVSDKPETTTLREFIFRELDARYFNPKWIEGMMEHGYAGARYMDSKFLENLWGWTVTNPEIIGSSTWDRVFDVYIKDEHNLGLSGFFKDNPYAYQSMLARMMETARKGYWDADSEVLQHLAQEFQQSVELHGVTCCHHTCGNLQLEAYIQSQTPSPQAPDTGSSGGSSSSRSSGSSSARPAVTPVSSGTGDQATNTTDASGVGETADKVAGDMAKTAEEVSGHVMQEVQDAAAGSTTSTPLIAIVLVLLVIASISAGFWFKRR
ncbi:MAG: cobaltochelatase subunit CobN [Candidatus Methanoculleus thermohydrogenotrophicum]